MRRFRRHDCSAAAGSIAFFAGLSLLPALLVLIAVLGFVFETSEVGRDAESEVLSAAATHLSPSLQSTVRTVLSEVRAGSSIGGPLGGLALLASALAGFIQLDRALERISRPRSETGEVEVLSPAEAVRRFVQQRLMAFAILSGVFVLVALGSTVRLLLEPILRAIESYGEGSLVQTARALTGAVPGLLFAVGAGTLVYRWVPRRRPDWRSALIGAMTYAVLWTIGRELVAIWLATRGLSSAYGIVGSFLVIQLWIYYASLSLLFGAEVTFVRQDDLRAGG